MKRTLIVTSLSLALLCSGCFSEQEITTPDGWNYKSRTIGGRNIKSIEVEKTKDGTYYFNLEGYDSELVEPSITGLIGLMAGLML